jgi:hypothetical protein
VVTFPAEAGMVARLFTSIALGAGMVAVAAGTAAAAQAPAPAAKAVAKPYSPPKTAWGDPDIGGSYTNTQESGTPFERPAEFAGKRLGDITPEDLAKAIAVRNERKVERAPTLGGETGTGAGPIHWFEDYGARNSRAWMVSDPPDGKIPATTEEARQRAAAEVARRRGGNGFNVGPFDGPEDFSLYDRCITRGMPGSMMPAIYGNSYRIVQAQDSVAITYEMVHDTRIIPLDRRPHLSPAIEMDMGDARGHWEGDTLVVETTNFRERSAFRGASSHLKITERFTPVAPNKIQWSATLEDPHTWVRPWTFGMMLTHDEKEQVFEYGCHEGNHGLYDILSAERAEEAAAAGAVAK